MGDPYAAPKARSRDATTPLAVGECPRGARYAGALFLANAAFVLLEAAVTSTKQAPPTNIIVPLVIDGLIGASLLQGKDKYRTWAIVRVALGLVLFGILRAISGSYWGLFVQSLVSGSLLCLLLGNPTRPRIVLGFVGFGLYAAIEVAGLVMLAR